MKKLVSQFRCSNCKTPILNALKEECPKCGKRLITTHLSEGIRLLIIATFLAIIMITGMMFFDGRYDNPVVTIASISLVSIILGGVIVVLYIKNKRRLEKDKEFVGTGMTAELERHLTYIDDSSINKKKLIIAPGLTLAVIAVVMSMLFIDLGFYDYIPNEDFPTYFILLFILLFTFAITGFYSAHLHSKELKKLIKKLQE